MSPGQIGGSMKILAIAACLCLMGCIVESPLPPSTDPPVPDVPDVDAGSTDDGIQHQDGTCFAPSFGVYPQEYAWCKQEFPQTPIPFACVEPPPPTICVPFYMNGWYPD